MKVGWISLSSTKASKKAARMEPRVGTSGRSTLWALAAAMASESVFQSW